MKNLPDESINLVMTSPPYWGLRDYHTKGQVGLEPTLQDYVEKLKRVGEEVKRILARDGSLYLVLGDTFMNKHKLGIPWRVRFALNDIDWISRSDIVWHKPNAMPASVKDRLNCTYEMIFHFVKSKKYYYNLDVIREPHKTVSLKRYLRAVQTSLTTIRGKTTDKKAPSHYKKMAHAPKWFIKSFAKDKRYKGKFKDMKEQAEKYGSPRARTQRKPRGIPINPPHHPAYGKYWSKINRNMHNHPLGRNPGDVISTDDIVRSFGFDPEVACRSCGRKYKRHVSRFRGLTSADHYPIFSPCNPIGKNPGDIIEALSERQKDLIKFFKQKGSGGNPGHGIEGSTLGSTHPLGKNPGDVLTTVLDKTRQKANGKMKEGGMLHKNDPERVWHPDGRNPGDFWKINTKPFKGAHFAVYPEELCVKPILSSSRPDDIVLDPFIGSGTTAVVAKKLERRYLGCDINPDYVKIAKERISKVIM
ncbi:MAG: site-specific DNA-methyltransferase [archaeon]|nr:site-specific DNA-methyltransferase [archaeon]